MKRNNFFNGKNTDSIISTAKELLFDLDNEDCQKLLKLIKYDGRNPFSEDDITYDELIDMIHPDSKNRRIFTINRNSEVQGEVRNEFRFWAGSVRVESGRNLYIGKIILFMQFITHEDIREISIEESEAIPIHSRELTAYNLCNKLLLGSDSGGYGVFTTDPSLGLSYITFNNNTKWHGIFYGVSAKSG